MKELSGLSNLEYLEIEGMYIKERAFKGLNKLIKLVLNLCKVDKLDSEMLKSQKNKLRFLIIHVLEFDITLDSLKRLKVLSISGFDNLNCIKSVPTESLEVLNLNTNLSSAYGQTIDQFFERVNLSNLAQLRFKLTELDYRSKWFSGLTNIKRLSFFDNEYDSANFLKPLKLSHIFELDLSSNRIEKLERNNFKGLKSLKRLNLSANPLKKLNPGVFNGLENLETLLLKYIHHDLLIVKDSLLGLSNLKVLDLSNSICRKSSWVKISIDSQALDQTAKLQVLELMNSKLDFEHSMIPRLAQLERIVLCPGDLPYYEFYRKDELNFTIIESH